MQQVTAASLRCQPSVPMKQNLTPARDKLVGSGDLPEVIIPTIESGLANPKALLEGFDLDSLNLGDFAETPVEAERVITKIPIRKPEKDAFIRCHPDRAYERKMLTIQMKAENDFYVVVPSLRDALSSEPLCVPRALVPYIDYRGELFIWPIRLPGPDGKIDDYNGSAYEHANRARSQWARILANQSLRCYDFCPPRGVLAEPKWPAMSAEQMYEIALKNRVIATLDHALLKRLRGEV